MNNCRHGPKGKYLHHGTDAIPPALTHYPAQCQSTPSSLRGNIPSHCHLWASQINSHPKSWKTSTCHVRTRLISSSVHTNAVTNTLYLITIITINVHKTRGRIRITRYIMLHFQRIQNMKTNIFSVFLNLLYRFAWEATQPFWRRAIWGVQRAEGLGRDAEPASGGTAALVCQTCI